jgi:CheY-like chemotaxis protein
MNAILGYAQPLRAEVGLSEAQYKKLDVIRSSGDHLLSLIDDILEMSRIESGGSSLSIEPYDLHALIDQVHSMFVHLAASRSLKLNFEMTPELPRALSGDARKIRQVLINLIGNAIKFTKTGGVHVRVSPGVPQATRHKVMIQVEDTGPGIATEDYEHIFSAFGQSSAGRRSGGTGLGLTISRSFARLMGGDLTVTSVLGAGSTFTFTFEAERSPTEVWEKSLLPASRQRVLPHDARRKVLIADDVLSNRELLREELERAGFETCLAASGEEALTEHERLTPDLVMMDLHMPGMGGAEALRALRAKGVSTPIIVTTANADTATAELVRDLRVQGVLRKPYDGDALLQVIGSALRVQFHESKMPDPPAVSPGDQLRASREVIPADLVADLTLAARQARATRLLELADRLGVHSPRAARAVRTLASDFDYVTLLEVFDERKQDAIQNP